MPLTPSIGLSVIIHICIIFWNKAFHLSLKNKKYKVPAAHFLGFIGVLMVSIIILAGAFSIVHLSIIESHSSIRFVARYFEAAPTMPAVIIPPHIDISDAKIVYTPVSNLQVAESGKPGSLFFAGIGLLILRVITM